MKDLLIRNASVCRPHGGRDLISLLVRGGKIEGLGPKINAGEPAGIDVIDAGGRLLTPGLIDLHIHGVLEYLFEDSREALQKGVASLARFGVTTVLPTLYRCLGDEHLAYLRELSAAVSEIDTVRVPGFHFEGPFLRLGGAGAMTLDGNVELLEQLLDAAEGRMSAMSISPDTPNIVPVIERLRKAGVAVFITHTAADVDQTVAAVEAGARHATHFYDVFPPPPETEPGARPVGCVEVVLADQRVSVDFIADGVHVHPMAIRMALAAKPIDGVILITDANIGAGRGPGVYDTPWGFKVRVGGGAARVDLPGDRRHGALAGSTLTMPRGIANLRRWLDLPEAEVWAMASRNPARQMGWQDRGSLEPGQLADVVLWDDTPDSEPIAWKTFVGGRCVFDAEAAASAIDPESSAKETIDV